MSRVACWLLSITLLGVFVVAVGFALRERLRAGRGLPAYSVYTDRGDGLGEAAHLLDKLGWKAVAMTRVTPLPGQRGLLVLAEPPEDALGETDARALLRWVEDGNTLLLASRHYTGQHGPVRRVPSWLPLGRGLLGLSRTLRSANGACSAAARDGGYPVACRRAAGAGGAAAGDEPGRCRRLRLGAGPPLSADGSAAR